MNKGNKGVHELRQLTFQVKLSAFKFGKVKSVLRTDRLNEAVDVLTSFTLLHLIINTIEVFAF